MLALGLTLAIASLDWYVVPNYSLGLLYILPIMLLGTVSGPWVLLCAAIGCSVLREMFAPFGGDAGWPVRILLTGAAFVVAGLFSAESVTRRLLQTRYSALEDKHTQFREVTQDHLQAVIDTVPLAFMTLGRDGCVLHANSKARELLGVPLEHLTAKDIRHLLPDLRKELESGHGLGQVGSFPMTVTRSDDSHLRCCAWASWHRTGTGVGLTCVFWDDSDELRKRQTESLERLAQTSDLLISAAMHEVRNVTSAAVITLESSRHPDIRNISEVQMATALMRQVQRIASHGVVTPAPEALQSVALRQVLDDLRIIAEPVCSRQNIRLVLGLAPDLPTVMGDHQSILQILLNLLCNSVRALAGSAQRTIAIGVSETTKTVSLRFHDSGPGIPQPEFLFKAYAERAHGTGLGLFISKALAQGCDGDLQYEVTPGGACFRIDLVRGEPTGGDV